MSGAFERLARSAVWDNQQHAQTPSRFRRHHPSRASRLFKRFPARAGLRTCGFTTLSPPRSMAHGNRWTLRSWS